MTAHVSEITLGSPANLVAGEHFSVAEVRYADGAHYAPHVHPRTYIALTLTGSFHEHVGDRSDVADSASVVVMPAGTSHENRISARGARSMVVTIEPSLREVAGAEPSRWRIEQGGASARVLLRMYRLFRERAEADAMLELLIEWIDTANGARVQREITPSARVRLAMEFLRGRISQPFALRDVANVAGVDQAYLSRAFRRYYGETMGEALRRFRAKRAAALLASTTLPIGEIALRCGFADQSHLTRVFRSHSGLTPLAYRRLVR